MSARPLLPEEQRLVEARLGATAPYTPKLTLAPGETAFLVHRTEVPTGRITRAPGDYEAIALRIRAPAGLTVHRRVDEARLMRAGKTTEITFVYAISVEPDATRGGTVDFVLALVERTGFANEVATLKVKHDIAIRVLKPSQADLGADLLGYRWNKERAADLARKLAHPDLRLKFDDGDDLGRLDRIDAVTASKVLEFDRLRRRMGVAKRHLMAATKASDRAIARLAADYLRLLDAPENAIAAMPILAPTAGGDMSSIDPDDKTAPNRDASGVVTLTPLEHQARAASTDAEASRESTAVPERSPKAALVAPSAPLDGRDALIDKDAEEEAEQSNKRDGHATRSLVLDDPNIAHGIWLQASYATVTTQQTAAVPTWLLGVQVGILRDFGAELVVPLAHVSVDLDRAGSTFVVGNVLLSPKYRFLLPAIQGENPTVTVRARWGIPFLPGVTIPRTELGSEQFTVPARFADLYAFLPEKHDIGFGANTTLTVGPLEIGGQVYFDTYIPTSNSRDSSSFSALGYGVSLGTRWLDNAIGPYLEARGSWILAGTKRHEATVYGGARALFWNGMEPALWVGLPLGSTGDASSLQLGGEIRFSFDLPRTSSVKGPTHEGARPR